MIITRWDHEALQTGLRLIKRRETTASGDDFPTFNYFRDWLF